MVLHENFSGPQFSLIKLRQTTLIRSTVNWSIDMKGFKDKGIIKRNVYAD